jgi:hypothetical protein
MSIEFGRRNRIDSTTPLKLSKSQAGASARVRRPAYEEGPLKLHNRRLGTHRLIMMAVASAVCLGLGWWCVDAMQSHQEFRGPFIIAAICGMFVVRCLLFRFLGCGANDADEITDFELMGFGGFGGDGSDSDGSGDGGD